jgi:hypothetical protein
MAVFRGFMRVDSVSLRFTPQCQSDLRNQIHRELVNRPFQFQKRSQYFIGTHDEPRDNTRIKDF